jgi:hypothetical protein
MRTNSLFNISLYDSKQHLLGSGNSFILNLDSLTYNSNYMGPN